MSANLVHAVSLVLTAPCYGDALDEVTGRPGGAATASGDVADDREVAGRSDDATSCSDAADGAPVGDLFDCAAASVCSDLIAALVEAGAGDDMV